MDAHEIYNVHDNEDEVVNKRKRMKKKYPTSEYVSKKRKEFYQKHKKAQEESRTFHEVFEETIASREVLSQQQNRKQKPKYRKKTSLSMGQSRIKMQYM